MQVLASTYCGDAFMEYYTGILGNEVGTNMATWTNPKNLDLYTNQYNFLFKMATNRICSLHLEIATSGSSFSLTTKESNYEP